MRPPRPLGLLERVLLADAVRAERGLREPPPGAVVLDEAALADARGEPQWVQV